MVGFPSFPGKVRLHLEFLESGSLENLSFKIQFGLEWNLQPAKAFPNKRMARPVPSVEFAHQVQGAMREKIRCREL